jgi:hypothetical protein
LKKQLHPGLFEETRRSGGIGGVFEPLGGADQVELTSLQWASETKRLEKKVEGLKVELTAKTEDTVKQSKQMTDMLSSRLGSLESRFETLSQELKGKLNSLSAKVTEKHMADLKTQALIDRHTQLLRQFESRVLQLQKVIEDQEFQILNYQAALEEARQELVKLKRL